MHNIYPIIMIQSDTILIIVAQTEIEKSFHEMVKKKQKTGNIKHWYNW